MYARWYLRFVVNFVKKGVFVVFLDTHRVFGLVVERFPSDFRAIFRAISERFPSSCRAADRAISERFPSDVRAISERFSSVWSSESVVIDF